MKKIGLFVLTFLCFTSAIGQSTSHIIDSKLQKCNEAYYYGEVDRCIQMAQQTLSYLDSLSINKPSAYVMLYNRMGLSLWAKGKYDESFQSAQNAMDYIKANKADIEIVEIVITSQLLTGEYRRTGDIDKLRIADFELLQTMEDSNDNGLGESYSRLYLYTIYELATSFIAGGNLNAIDSLTTKAYNYINSDFFSFSALNAESVSSIASLLYRTNINEAQKLDDIILYNISELLNNSSIEDIILYNPTTPFLLALPITSYTRLGQKDKALEYARMLHVGVQNFCQQTKRNVGMGDYLNAAVLYIPCYSLFLEEGYLGDAFSVLLDMSTMELYMGLVSKETDNYKDRITAYRLTFSDFQSQYLKSIGDYKAALNSDTLALHLVMGFSNHQPTAQIASRLYTVSRTYKRLNDIESNIKFLYMAADCYEQALGTTSPYYISTSSECLYELIKNGFISDSIYGYIDSCMKEIKAIDIQTDNSYDWGLYYVSKCYMLLGDYDTAYYYLTLIDGRKDNAGDLILVMEAELECLLNMGNYNQASAVLYNLFNARKKQIKQNFIVMPGNLRTRVWNEISYTFLNIIPTTAYLVETDSNIICATDAILLSKGVLLNLEHNLRETINNSGDSLAISWYDSISFYMGLLKHMDTVSSYSAKYTPEELKIEVLKAEQQLSNRVKTYGDITRDMSIEWTDVQKALNSNDAAIEFNSFTKDNDTTIYVAYVIRPKWAAPKQVVLKKLIKGEKLLTSNPYLNSNLSKTIWEKLSPVLNGTKTIYFAPAGELYNIAIESLPDYEDSTNLISDRYNLYRLSSTRELAKDKKKVAIKNSNSFGGLRYDSKIDNSEQGVDKQKSFTYFPWSADSVSAIVFEKMPGYLPGSLSEVLYVDSIMGEASISSVIDTGINGTEAKFKSLSGSNTNLLLISTHGFYFNGIQEIKQDRESIVGEDKSMTRSGLLFSGANNTFRNPRANTDTYNDGILTAQEIAQMDLKNVDLVVLSACETGLGELKGDGVFGLQRGFKKAGVNSIIMSLWEVDDLATKYLMTQFYENWLIKKMPKQKALKAAQDFVRNFEVEDDIKWAAYRKKNKADKGVAGGQNKTTQNGKKPETARDASKDNNVGHKGKRMKPFEDPDNWAAFILLDGLD